MQKCLTIGVLAHVDAGKTTFSEQLLYHTNSIRKLGRVDHRDAFLDSEEMEKERKITIFSNHAAFEMGENRYYLLDTPGHVDFSSEMERAVQAMDYAILIVSCVEGIQAHTEQVWKLLEKYQVPVFLFLNKTDRTGADSAKVLHDLHKRFSPEICLCSQSFETEELDEDLIEKIAENDEELLESYLDGNYDQERWMERFRRMIHERKIFPCFSGSALQDEGIDTFLKAMDTLTLPRKSEEGFQATAWQVRHDNRGERIVFLKIQSGTLHAREEISIPLPDGSEGREKVNEIRIYHGRQYTSVKEVKAGEICAVTGLSSVRPGDGIGTKRFHLENHLVPMLGAKVILPPEISVSTALGYFRQLEDEDPMLGVSFEESLQEIRIRVMGQIQLEVLKEVCQERFKMEVEFGECRILYRETISSPVIGYGHYEPLRHYAEVHLRLSPNLRGGGITFDSECPSDELAQNWQNLIETHVFEKKHKGVLTGSELTDVHITLLTGRAHLKHTEGGDFREATYRAIRQGLEQALSDGNVVLLEPYYRFEISVMSEQLGRLLSDLQKMDISFDPPQMEDDRSTVCGRGPVAALADYGKDFVSFTRGKGVMSLTFDGYEPCGHQEKVAEEINYDRERDMENPSCSVFCAHGAGFPVPWYEVPNYVHCK